MQIRPGRSAGVVVVCVFEPVQRRREHVVEGIQVARGQQRRAVEQARVLRQFAHGFGLHAAQEHGGVDQPVEAAADRPAAGRQVQRRADAGHRVGQTGGMRAGLAGPAHQRIASERDAHGQLGSRMLVTQARQDPADLFMVARVVGARAAIELAAAASEVRHHEGQPARPRHAGESLGIVAARGAFESVEQHQQRRAGRGAGHQPVEVEKISIRRVQPLAAPRGAVKDRTSSLQGRPDGLQIAAGQPPGCRVVHGVRHRPDARDGPKPIQRSCCAPSTLQCRT